MAVLEKASFICCCYPGQSICVQQSLVDPLGVACPVENKLKDQKYGRQTDGFNRSNQRSKIGNISDFVLATIFIRVTCSVHCTSIEKCLPQVSDTSSVFNSR